MSKNEYLFKPRKSTSPRSTEMKHRHGRHHHHHANGHQHGHGHGHGQVQKIEIRVFPNPTWPKRRPGSVSREDEQAVSASSRPSQDSSVVKKQKECRLCNKVQEMRKKSENLTIPTESSDVIVQAADEKKFYCHSFVLEIWAPNLLTKAKPADGEKRQVEIKFPDFKSDVIGACLRLMYSETMEDMGFELITDIMKLANVYEIPDLKTACLQSASNTQLTPGNACLIWHYAVVHNVQPLQERAIKYVLDNVEAIANDPQGRVAWDEMTKKPEMLVELFYAISENTKLKPPAVPPRDTQMDEMWANSDGLRNPYAYPDMVVVTKTEKKFHVHLPLITLSSPKFAQHLYEQGPRNGGRVPIQDFDDDVVEEFLRGLYRQEPSAAFANLVDHVYVMACDYEADTLADACEREIALWRMQSVEGAIEQLKEAEEHRMQVAKTVCCWYLFDKGRGLSESAEWKKLVTEYPLLIAEMIVDWEMYRQRK